MCGPADDSLAAIAKRNLEHQFGLCLAGHGPEESIKHPLAFFVDKEGKDMEGRKRVIVFNAKEAPVAPGRFDEIRTEIPRP